MEFREPVINSAFSISTNDELNTLINVVSEHLSSHPIEDFDLHVAKLLGGNAELDLLNSYKVSSIYIYGIVLEYVFNLLYKLILR